MKPYRLAWETTEGRVCEILGCRDEVQLNRRDSRGRWKIMRLTPEEARSIGGALAQAAEHADRLTNDSAKVESGG